MSSRMRRASVVAGTVLALVLAAFGTRAADRPVFGAVSGGKPRLIEGDRVRGRQRSPQTDLRVDVAVAISYDSATRLYTYEYTVTNRRTSKNSLDVFAVDPVPTPVDLRAPLHWKGFYGWEDHRDAAAWVVWDGGRTVVSPDSMRAPNITASPFELAPGQTAAGFTIVSRHPPTAEGSPIAWYAQGFDTLQDVSDLSDEAVTPSPNSFFDPSHSIRGPIAAPDVNSRARVAAVQRPALAGLLAPAQNPTTGGVSIGYALPARSDVLLGIYDTAGHRLAVLATGLREAGLHYVTWMGDVDAGGVVSPGVYVARLVVNGHAAGNRKITILR